MTVSRNVTINLNDNDVNALTQAQLILEDMLDSISDLEDDDIVSIEYGDGSFKNTRKDVVKAWTALNTLI